MMHINVEPDIRSGMILMKYAVNHPDKFGYTNHSLNKQKQGSINVMRVYYAFFLGFCQSIMGMLVELITIIFLAS